MERLMKILSKKHKDKAGFTLIELMIVVIIVGILAAAAVPIYTAYVKKAYKTEADASLGAIRTAEIAYKAETGDFIGDFGILEMTSADFAHNRYFGWDCFSIYTSEDPTYAVCDGSGTNYATGADLVEDIIRKIKLDSGELSDGAPP